MDKETVVATLAAHQGNIAAAARALSLHRTQLYRLMKRYGLAADLPVPPDAE